VQLWCRCFCTIVQVSHRARHHETWRRPTLRSALHMLHF
jgi:hypothetical protein